MDTRLRRSIVGLISALPPVQDALKAVVADAVAALTDDPADGVVNKTKAGRGAADFRSPAAMQLARAAPQAARHRGPPGREDHRVQRGAYRNH